MYYNFVLEEKPARFALFFAFFNQATHIKSGFNLRLFIKYIRTLINVKSAIKFHTFPNYNCTSNKEV